MNARIKLQHKISNKQKADIREYCANEMREQQKEHTRRSIKIFCVALHQTFGFGKDRIAKTLEAINQLSAERDKDEVFWTHIDRTLEQLGLKFNQENYEEMDI